MARQEVIDGPGVVAKILSRFPARERDRVVAAIRSEAPKVAASIERRMGDIARPERASITEPQNSPQPAYAPDVAPSPRAVTKPSLEKVYETKTEEVEAVIDAPPANEIEAAQSRILRRLEELYPDVSQGGERRPFKSRLA